MVSTWPMPMKRSRVFTMQAIINENVENSAEPTTIIAATARILAGENEMSMPIAMARR